MPTLARLVYPPEVFAEDLRGPQAIIVVPTMELGVQVCAVLALRTPHMFTFNTHI